MTNPALTHRPELFCRDTCHVCASTLPPPVLDLGMQPLCDDLVPIGDARETVKYPIQISLCPVCLTAHQVYQVAKETLFPKSYHYRPRFTLDVLNGIKSLVAEHQAEFGTVSGKLACDIGCNDGSLLNYFNQAGARTCGIEPTDAALEATAGGHHVIQGYFNVDSATRLVAEVGYPDVISFTNVFAHIESLEDTITALKLMVHEGTIIVIENHYLGSVLATGQFDTFYHEHPRTYSYRSFEFIARSLGGEVLFASFPKRYGGNIRVCIGNFNRSNRHPKREFSTVGLRDESDFPADLAQMQKLVDLWLAETKQQLQKLKDEGLVLCGKGYPGRASILINLLGVTEDEHLCVYEKPESLKLDHYLPGTRIEIVSDQLWMGGAHHPPAILIWAWHIVDEVESYLREHGYRGRIFTPLPVLRELV
ncbi:class I SAM-dependent methyltransferase [Prosthecobacter sp.]|uniref:class I SAM-dependent methyltransferase n=1 Tax=Prosthecobacter sp. TaxID=1965333 RepID=UPI002486FC3C|nr:class I SAM-dependent methyltransferase [Prosthecobacter sp.]MDI1311675.1 class I SAM-dependent methyltransferase [Prosthecobacter sp.]